MSRFSLEFRPTDLQRHADLCLRFIEDTHLCSFGSMDGFAAEDGQKPQHFIERIAAKLAQDPQSCLHVWIADDIVGQLNFGTFVDPSIGYISHFYVVPSWRGTGVATEMDDFATHHFKQRGYKVARLSVTSANARAMQFYQKHGWRDLGPREDRPVSHNMEKRYE